MSPNQSRHATRASSSSVLTNQRVRKRVPWRGKACIISLPVQPDKTESKENQYLTPRDVETRFAEWRAQGYDTAGFRLSPKPGGDNAQTRHSFPDPEDIRGDRAQRAFRVKIPNKAQWDTHVSNIREAKLRALGVSLGDRDPAVRESPITHSLTHHSSSHGLNLPISPCLDPPRSADSMPMYGITPPTRDFHGPSPHPSPSTIMATQQFANASVRHFPRYSMAQSKECSDLALPSQGLASETMASYQRVSETSRRAPANPDFVSSIPERVSPVFNGTLDLKKPSIRQFNNAVLPFHAKDLVAIAAQEQDGRSQSLDDCRSEEHRPYSNLHSTSPNLQLSNPQQDPSSGADIHAPIPRSLDERIPEALERYLHEAEDHVGVIRRQLPSDSSLARSQRSSESTGTLHDAAPSRVSQDRPNQRIASNPMASSLNALAPEFKAGSAVFLFGSSTVGTAMRPTAPAFTPAAASQPVSASREFSFSSSGPMFEPSSVNVGSDPSLTELPNGESKGIFSEVQYPLVSKPIKKSKAVPIRRPRDERRSVGLETEVQEDESGRITQAEGRQKRMRRSSREVFQNPDYGMPAQEPAPFVERDRNNDALEAMTGGKRNHARQDSMSLEKAAKAADQLKEIIDDLSASEGSSFRDRNGEAADSERREHNLSAHPEATWFDAPKLHTPSMKMTSARTLSPEKVDVNPAGPADGQSVTCGSKPEKAPILSARSPAERTRHLQESQTLSDSDTLKSLYREELSTTLSTPHRASFGRPPEHLRNGLELISSLDHGNDNEPRAQDFSETVPDGIPYIKSSSKETDAVLRHLYEERRRVRTKGKDNSYRAGDADGIGAHDFHTEKHKSGNTASPYPHSDAPSTSLGHRAACAYQYLPQTGSESADSSIVKMIAENARFSPSYRPSYVSDADPAALSGLASADSAATSEWNNTFSSSDKARIRERRSFFDTRVHDVVADVLQERLTPLERTLLSIQSSLVDMSKLSSDRARRRRSSDNAGSSDADDEEDSESNQSKTKSPARRRSSDKLKALIAQLPTAQQRNTPPAELASIGEDIKALKAICGDVHPSFADVKSVVEEAIAKQLRGRSVPIMSSHQSATVEKNLLQIAGLESMLRVAEERAEDELKARRATDDALADSQRLLRLALQDAAEQRESAEETERSLSAFHEERHDALRRTAILEGARESLQSSVSELAEKNAALEGTLEEYRLSSAQWRSEIESAKTENSDLRRTVTALKNEMEDGIRNRHALRAKFDQLQDEMDRASQSIARDQSVWRTKEEELKAESRSQAANYEREKQQCFKLEKEVAALSENLRCHGENHHQVAAQYERELYDQREVARLERDRVQRMTDEDSAAAANRLNGMRSDLERTVANLELQLERGNTAASADRERYEMSLQAAVESKRAALQEQQIFHDKVVKGLKEQHEQVSQNAARERQAIEFQNKERLALADERLLYYQDKIRHLEEKVEIAKSAAEAAVQSKQPASKDADQHRSSLSDSLPEKISPQALRESILVLQEQLQDRESQIEQLEQKLSTVDVDAPAKMKAQETEITWLRELLGVRVDDLEDLITALAQPAYDREAIKDAAIRLKANLRMEQQEKERAHGGGQLSTQLPSLSTLASSPRALPLAAAAAWGNWRKGWSAPSFNAFQGATGHIAGTPSRSRPSTESVVSGLLTPPNTDAGRSGEPSAALGTSTHVSLGKRPATGTRGQSVNSPESHRLNRNASPPMTPSLTRKANYDKDAAAANVEGIQDTVGMQEEGWAKAGDEEPFGPPLAAFPAAVQMDLSCHR